MADSLIETFEVDIWNVALCFFTLAQRLDMKRAGAVAAKKYFALERSGRRFEPIKKQIVSNASLNVSNKLPTLMLLLSGISSHLRKGCIRNVRVS
ncbi:hypothetical protein [Lapidilactobacillus bayanensis]|uniref:hypothetical protein n=1 Tax=Lapidilactobacillus bayanensis TaxID=2485998 RepID=UPI000F7A32A3|nr:hypothetical protein [Lapidilactobacillus bayanensis]